MPLNDVLRQRTQALASSLNSHRIILYTFVSLVSVSAVVANALKHYSNFYSVAISLSKSSRSVLVLANFGFLLALLSGHVVQRLFFGRLRPNEVERLYDRLWFFITESLLAFTIFRDEFDIPFALMFGFLLFVKSFHWLAGDRIEWMDQRPYPGPSLLFHFRMSILFVILWMTDFIMFVIAIENTLANGVGGMVLFASEYGILMASVVNTISKYLLSAYELRRAGRRGGENAPPWENKSMWLFYIELSTDFLKLTTYLVFFTIIITFYGLPLNIVRDVYITARSFIARLRALHRYQTATRNMDQRYPNATAEELAAMSDRTCIICREEMILHEPNGQTPADGPNTTPKKLPCGHVFHFHCLRSWLERQQSCPTCRRTVLEATPPAQQAGVEAAAAEGNRQQNPLDPREQNQNQPQRANNPLGNPLGLMGRLFGPPAQPNPGPNIQIPQILNDVAQNPGNVAGGQLPQGVIIQYHIQYQPPRNPQQNERNPNQPLQPPPQFPGFPGPGGVWQQWPVAPGPEDQNQPNIPTPTEPTRDASPSTYPSAPTPTLPGEPATGSSDPTNESGAPTTPREAAALAALRRLNGSTDGRPSFSRSASSTSAQTGVSPTTINPQALTRNPELSSTAPPLSTLNNPPNVPSLIPLYDYDAIGANLNHTSQQPNSLSHTIQPLTPNGTSQAHSTPEAHPLQNARLSPRSQAQSLRSDDHNTRMNGQSTVPSISQLPPNLTDEQLASMDSLTREAIDERLRVLEGVSSAVYRCIDDLMRMRSALPSQAMPSVPVAPHPEEQTPSPVTDGPSNSSEAPSSVTNGKMKAVDPVPSTVNEATAGEANDPLANSQ